MAAVEQNPATTSTPEAAANPFSTGGGGGVFELSVDAGLAAMLLVRGHAPGFEDTEIVELHLQSEHLGYETDDALLVGSDSTNRRRRQLWSVKHNVSFTESNTEFGEVIADAWADFTNPDRFDPDLDAIMLATGDIAKTGRHLITALELARASASAEVFFTNIAQPGFLSHKGQQYLNCVKNLCGTAAGREVLPEELWKLLRCFHVLSFDFGQTASQDEARMKTLLSVALRGSSGTSGGDLWRAIFRWVANLNPRAGSFTFESLPVEWKHGVIGIGSHFESGAIQRLRQHSADLLRRVRTSLGASIHLERKSVTDQLTVALANETHIMVTGEAGVGKSAAALSGLQRIVNGAPLFVFQATEFARDNLDHALADLRVSEPLPELSALFALQPRKFLLIESVERLLESTQRDAFFTLLQRLGEDSTWRVVLTCRQHAVEMVKDAFLTPLAIRCAEIRVPVLSEAELEEVIRQVPGIRSLVTNPRTRRLLRNPWFLDKACAVNWAEESVGEAIDERRLRDILWRQVIVREDVRTQGLHLQRDRVFRDVALRRARSLQSFVPVESGEEVAVQALVADELLVEEPATRGVAPAHDVLEDWALVRWIDELFRSESSDPIRFFNELGQQLSMRRSYRQWLGEMLAAGDVTDIRAFVERVLNEAELEPYWKDETLVSVLLSDHAARFIGEHEANLLAEDKQRLKQVIHLLRVACKEPNPHWKLSEVDLGKSFGDLHLIPKGSAWPALIRLIQRSQSAFGMKELPLLLGLLEDWKAQINWQAPQPEAAREAGLIATNYWNAIDGWRFKEELERLASILLACPQAIAAEFETLFDAAHQGMRFRDRNDILQRKLLASLEGWNACRFLPAVVAAVAERRWGIDRPLPKDFRNDYHSGMSGHFGLQPSHTEYFPASAFQGPFFALLQGNSDVGLALITKLVNISTERMVELGLDRNDDPPVEVTIDFGGGTTTKQWANSRLWSMYRQGPAPDLVESALMALEKWLLDRTKTGRELATISRGLILSSNSVSITAVVASVAMAYPDSIGETALALFRTREFFRFDLERSAHDRSPLSAVFSASVLDASKRIYHGERVESDKLPHRQQTLETLACSLQTSSMRDAIWKIIDDYKAALPPVESQTDEDKIWRWWLHRMDLRNFRPQERLSDGRVLFTPGPAEPEIRQVLEKGEPTRKAFEEGCSIFVWGKYVFDREEQEGVDPAAWREMLVRAQVPPAGDVAVAYLNEGGPAYVAAVCVRDHWAELDHEQRTWCRDYLIEKVMAERDTANELTRVTRFDMAGSRAAAQVLPLLLDDADDSAKRRVREAIACAITHAVEEVRQYTAIAIGRFLWQRDSALASSCIVGLLELAQLERVCYGLWRQESPSARDTVDEMVREHIQTVREKISSARSVPTDGRLRFSMTDSFSAQVLPLIANIIYQRWADPLAQRIWKQIAESFARSWVRRHERRDMRDFQIEIALRRQFGDFIVQCEPGVALELWRLFAAAIGDKAAEVAEVFKWITLAEDVARKEAAFWAVWQNTADAILAVPQYTRDLTREHSGLAKLAGALLFDHIDWKPEAKDWPPLHRHEQQLGRFFSATGSAPEVCKSFVRLSDSIGNSLLPEALIWLDERLQQGDVAQMIGDRNSLFSLARMLTPLVFSQTNVLRSSREVRDATLRILDAMVQQGSSAAFRMRDFLVTPTSPSLQAARASS